MRRRWWKVGSACPPGLDGVSRGGDTAPREVGRRGPRTGGSEKRDVQCPLDGQSSVLRVLNHELRAERKFWAPKLIRHCDQQIRDGW